MIARTWSGRARRESADAYREHLESVVLPEIRRIRGHRGAYVLQRELDFQVITLWDSMDAIRQFAGDDTERAVVPVEARALLSSFEDRVSHFDVVHAEV